MGTEIQQLSHRTSDHFKYLDRQTAQWLEKKPSAKSEATNPPQLAPTWADLTRTRTFFSNIRLTPISKISKWALHAFPSERVCELAQPRPYARGWQPELPLPTPVSRASLTAVASPRTCKLAQPKKRYSKPEPSHLSEPRPMTHLTSAHLSHLSMLASEFPKGEHPLYQRQRSARWPVSAAARNYFPSQRVLELSCPRIRKDVYDGYNPFVVSHAALCADPSPRTLQLSVPLPRKCTPKASPYHM
ncbi:sperm microtubule associated protein 2 isoform X2 [Poecilia latipinna]|uniref:sperm microtubule associated protein 2 isoform X2 n=1 Tax=Poecilia latipinna TaxID=48699 RepID=UPI00072E91D6|nr:PREDICTED: testicular haploid expressed gene protein isoform X2 [Poecilia latipinna]